MPGHAYSWRMADSSITAQCPSYISNINNIPLNPANEKTYTYIRGAIKELMEKGAFNQSTFAYIHRMMHLGGDEMVSGCWREDPTIYKYMSERGMSTAQLWQEFHKKVYDIFYELFGSNLPYQVYWDDAFSNGNYFDTQNAIIHYWTTIDKSAALAKGLRVIQSTYWYLDQMHPGSGNHYFFQDTWQDFYKVDLLKGVDSKQRSLVLGGGACQWGEWVYQSSIEQHMYPRALAISEVLWSNPQKREITPEVIERLDSLGCKLYQSGLKVGALDSGRPCLGYPDK